MQPFMNILKIFWQVRKINIEKNLRRWIKDEMISVFIAKRKT